MHILYETARVFNKNISSGVWKKDEEMYEFFMLFLELIAEGKTVFDLETGKMVFLKPVGDPPSEEMWKGIQKRINSSRPAIRAAFVRSVRACGRQVLRVAEFWTLARFQAMLTGIPAICERETL
jgi:hypothetical protein